MPRELRHSCVCPQIIKPSLTELQLHEFLKLGIHISNNSWSWNWGYNKIFRWFTFFTFQRSKPLYVRLLAYKLQILRKGESWSSLKQGLSRHFHFAALLVRHKACHQNIAALKNVTAALETKPKKLNAQSYKSMHFVILHMAFILYH